MFPHLGFQLRASGKKHLSHVKPPEESTKKFPEQCSGLEAEALNLIRKTQLQDTKARDPHWSSDADIPWTKSYNPHDQSNCICSMMVFRTWPHFSIFSYSPQEMRSPCIPNNTFRQSNISIRIQDHRGMNLQIMDFRFPRWIPRG